MSGDDMEARAKVMGWMPKEQFSGPDGQWLDAAAYVERGESIMPILKANNRKLSERLSATEQELATYKQQLADASGAIEELKNWRSASNIDKVKDQKTEILSGLAQAKREGDVDAEVRLTDKLTEINAALKAPPPPPAPAPTPPAAAAPQLTPEGIAWLQSNEWFGKDPRRTGLMQGLTQEWKASGNPVGTREYFAYVDAELGKIFDTNASRREAPSKVEGSTVSGGSGLTSGRTFADLPRDAKEACDRMAARLVGKGKAYATKADWQKDYVANYDWS